MFSLFSNPLTKQYGYNRIPLILNIYQTRIHPNFAVET